MKNSIFKKVAILYFILAFLVFPKQAFPLDRADYLDELLYLEFQISAVTTDMYMYLGWFEDKKDWIKEASAEAINDLNEIEKYIKELDAPGDLAHLKEMNLEVVSKLKGIYSGIEAKENNVIKSEFESFGKLYTKYSDTLKEAMKEYRYMQELPEGFNPMNEEVKLATNEEDKDTYRKAVRLIDDKQYNQAYGILSDLKNKYKGSPFKRCIDLRISDCILKADTGLKTDDKFEATEDALEILSSIIDKDAYSPVLYEAFYKWRTMDQYFNHGMSNMSEIPNKEYNKRRWKIIQVIKRYLKDNPEDAWAREQVDLLLSLPNIRRGGPMGNDNLIHWGSLYVDLSRFQEGTSDR